MLTLLLSNLVHSASEHNHMKVKLLRPTMVAGVPTDSGSIIDVEQQTGEYLVAIDKAELVVETCEAPTVITETEVESEEKDDDDEVDFSQMTKAELESYGRSLGLELDKRHNKADLISELEKYLS